MSLAAIKAFAEEAGPEALVDTALGVGLVEAAYVGNVALVRKFLALGATVDYSDEETALCLASQCCNMHEHDWAMHDAREHVDCVNVLIAHGADLNKENSCGETPLFIAAAFGKPEVIKILVAAGADRNKADNYSLTTPLCVAVQNNHMQAVQALIDAGADVDKGRTTDGGTPLFVAAQKNHLQAVQALIDAGADVDKGDTSGVTPLFIAAQNNHLQAVQALIAAGADVDKASNGDVVGYSLVIAGTPLFIAARTGHLQIVRALVGSGADLYKAGGLGRLRTPLATATENGRTEVVLYLERAARNHSRYELLLCVKLGRDEVNAGRGDDLHPLLNLFAQTPAEVIREHILGFM